MVKGFSDQKEYLKKYLTGNKQKTKKKKTASNPKGVKLIDDDETIKTFDLDDEDLILGGEDAPQIILGEGVEISSLKDSLKKWKNISAAEPQEEKVKFLNNFARVDETYSKNSISRKENEFGEREFLRKDGNTSTVSRTNEKSKDSHHETKPQYLKEKLMSSKSAHSPDLSPKRTKTNSNRDLSPRRCEKRRLSKEKRSESEKNYNRDFSPKRYKQRSFSRDLSPRRFKNNNLNRDLSQQRATKNRKSKDLTPRRNKHISPGREFLQKRHDRKNMDRYLSPRRSKAKTTDAVAARLHDNQINKVSSKRSTRFSDISPQKKPEMQIAIDKERSSADNRNAYNLEKSAQKIKKYWSDEDGVSPTRKEKTNSNRNSSSRKIKKRSLSRDFSQNRYINRNLDGDLSPKRPSANTTEENVSQKQEKKEIYLKRKSRFSDISPRTKAELQIESGYKELSPSVESLDKTNQRLEKNKYKERVSVSSERRIKNWGEDSSPRRTNKRSISRSFSQSRHENSSINVSELKTEKSSKRKSRFTDISPRSKAELQKDLSPPRHNNFCKSNSRLSDRRLSPVTNLGKPDQRFKNTRSDDQSLSKMADGKYTGLTTAVDLKKELKQIKNKEENISRHRAEEMGKFAEPVVRNNTRARVETQDEKIKNIRQEEENKKRQEVYNRWGKGLKQIEDHREKLADQQYESNKPLARYADDKDLDAMLKTVERDGDPMLQYLRSKKEKDKVNQKQPELPTYKGSYPENRFAIRPGYRWDGVDRSNGYEKKYFDKQNAKQALQEEAYRYSTEDM